MKKKVLLEIACFNEASARIALDSGAARIELCRDYSSGGLSPGLAVFKKIKKQAQVPVFVMIRERAGDFFYDSKELKAMIAAIHEYKDAGCEGFVFGCLRKKNTGTGLDTGSCKLLVDAAAPFDCTLHRAFDRCSDQDAALEEAINCGFTRILSSGDASTALVGSVRLKLLIRKSAGRITVMPGGSVRKQNIRRILEQTGASEIHSAAYNAATGETSSSEIQEMLKIIGS